MKKILFLTIALVLIVGLLISGCSKESSTPAASATKTPTSGSTTAAQASKAPKHGGTLTFIGDTGPGAVLGWPPEMFTAVTHWWVYNGMVKDWWNGDITPDLATSWDVDAKAPSITFHLRKGVKFHDGSTMDAAAVKFSYDGQLEAKKRPAWKSIEIVDDYTVKVNLNYYDNTILRSFENEQIISPTEFKNMGLDYMRTHPIGTGPFKFVKYDQDSLLVGERFADYWDTGKPYLDKLQVKYIPDRTTQKAAMQSGEGDVVLVEYGKQTDDYKKMNMFDMLAQPQATAFMCFDDKNKDSPFYDIRVRQAVDYALDREWLATNLGFGQWQPCYQLPPRPNVAWDKTYVGRKHDVAKAKALLAEAGYPNGLQTQLIPNPEGVNRDVWVAVQSQLKEAGINADLQFVENSRWSDLRFGAGWHNGILGDAMPSWGNMNVAIDMMFGPNAMFFPSVDKARPDWVAAINASKATEKNGCRHGTKSHECPVCQRHCGTRQRRRQMLCLETLR